MRLTDSHCHLAMLEPERAEEVLVRARAEGVAGFLVPGTAVEDSTKAVSIGQQHPDVWSAVGFHPHEAKDCDDEAFNAIATLAAEQKVAAIGEIGLDYHYMHSPREVQQDVFMRHLRLARERDLPVIIHNRESTEDLIDLLMSEEARGTRGVLHSFTESLEVARKLLDMGFFISFSGIVTFRTAEPLREVARALPHDRVLIETDTPYLAPVPHRGKENEPAFVTKTAEVLAGLWGRPLDDVAEQTTANFERAFGVRVSS
jgi:TatD DNase family protein